MILKMYRIPRNNLGHTVNPETYDLRRQFQHLLGAPPCQVPKNLGVPYEMPTYGLGFRVQGWEPES